MYFIVINKFIEFIINLFYFKIRWIIIEKKQKIDI